MTSRHVFLTGEPGVGKSTIVKAVRARLGAAIVARGFFTLEQRGPEGERAGFRSYSVASPECVQLATLEPTGSGGSGSFIGPFRVHLDEVVAFCRRALAQPSEEQEQEEPRRPCLVVMDEVGAMQLLSAELQALFSEATASGHCFGTIPSQGRHDLPFVEALRARSDVAVLEVTAANRDELVGAACSLLYRTLFPAEVARAIEDKAALALRYLSELPARLEAVEPSSSGAYRFTGDHGTYELRPTTASPSGLMMRCSCPFYGQRRTCSHTIALALREEQRRRKSVVVN